MARQSLPASEPFNPVDSIEYSQNHMVIRTIVDNKADTITLFVFDVGQGLSEYSTPFDAIVQLLDGDNNDKLPIQTLSPLLY